MMGFGLASEKYATAFSACSEKVGLWERCGRDCTER